MAGNTFGTHFTVTSFVERRVLKWKSDLVF